MRSFMRDINLGRDPDDSIPQAVGMDAEDMYEMFRLLAIAKYDDRYVIPTAHAEQAHGLEELATDCPVLRLRGPDRCSSARARVTSPRSPSRTSGCSRSARPRRSSSAAAQSEAASTCSTGTGRVRREASSPSGRTPMIFRRVARAQVSRRLPDDAAHRLAGDLGPAGLPDAGVGGAHDAIRRAGGPPDESVSAGRSSTTWPSHCGSNATTSRRSTTRASALCT